MKKLSFYLLIFVLLVTSVSALRISGDKVKFNIPFEPNYTLSKTFTVTNNDGYISSYDIFPIYMGGADLREYFTVEPNKFEGVGSGDSREFKVTLNLPEKIDYPGITETWVKVKTSKVNSVGISAVPALAIRYIFFILYPFKYLEWGFSAPNLNVDEESSFRITMNNLGEPVINSAKANIEIIDMRTNNSVTTLKTSTTYNIQSKETPEIKATFSSVGLKPGQYKAIATFSWDENISTEEKFFRIGQMDVVMHNFTRLFEVDSINRMFINVSSGWNNKIKHLDAKILIYDLETNQELTSFKALSSSLDPWENKKLEAYFDTKGLEKKEYKAVIEFKFDGLIKKVEGIIRIDENINAEIVDEIPGKFNLNFSEVLTTMNLMIFLLVVFLLINVYLLVTYVIKKEKKIDPEVIIRVKKLQEKYNDLYIKDLMIKRGWDEPTIDKILRKARK
jgi:hypothetical protein